MNSFDPQREDSSIKRRWHQHTTPHINNTLTPTTPSSYSSSSSLYANPTINTNTHRWNSNFQSFPELDSHDLAAGVVPAVTVVLEGRSICQRINLHNHASYHSLAKALRHMFVDIVGDGGSPDSDDDDLDLSSAIPGHLIAYEDMENDLLLAGDLNWK